MPRQQDAVFLGCTKLFGGLDAGALDAVAALATSRAVGAGQAVFRQGAEATHLHLVVTGRVKIAQVNGDGLSLTIRFMGPGEVPGCVAIFRHVPFPANATAVVDSRLLLWSSARVGEIMERHPRLAANALEVVGTQTQEMLHRLREFAMEPVERRIARALLRLAGQAGRRVDTGLEIDFPLSRQDIAEMTGTTLYTVSRTLREWERRGVVQSARRRVVVRDPARLGEMGANQSRSRPREGA
ncbi:MAG TPA: Crp/Fnr family transcriptional regulator [Longimicrobium sp.]|jgi:CRP/FNR family transcriptional regulator, nitrogen oxide reductase regulator|nr:Crp/Fnr family transcriptional regulator [Longimicrobium sp.]